MPERRPKNSELRLRRLSATDESEAPPRGILEIFAEDERPADADEALTRSDDESPRQ